jgi:hypothetical protein
MTSGDLYRAKAADLNARAARERTPALRSELENLALAYLRLAEQADRNARTDLVYESPSPRAAPPAQPQQQQQQQQQPQPKTED